MLPYALRNRFVTIGLIGKAPRLAAYSRSRILVPNIAEFSSNIYCDELSQHNHVKHGG